MLMIGIYHRHLECGELSHMKLTLRAELHSFDEPGPGTYVFALAMGQTISHFPIDDCTLESHSGWHTMSAYCAWVKILSRLTLTG